MKYSLLTLLLLIGSSLPAQVTYEQILHADREPQNWLTYSGGYASQRYSRLDRINHDNVKNLALKWVYRPKSPNKMEVTPLVVNGILYEVQGNEVAALDASTGRPFWTFHYEIPPESNAYLLVCKGLAMAGDTLFWATYDGHLIAINAKNGRAIWNHTLFDWRKGLQLNMAPLVIKNMVVLGTADNESGTNCWIAAYDVKTGKEVWRFWTAPNDASDPQAKTWGNGSYKHGGDPIWVTGSYDPETNLTFWGTGDPNPGWNGDPRPGDDIYGDCVVALDADTGKLKWYYQFTPHDEFDWDSVEVPVLADIDWQGKPRKVMLWANRNGFFYVLDRTTGEFLLGKAFVKQNWNVGFDQSGRPIKDPNFKSSFTGTLIRPGVQGGTNWYSPSYSPRTQLFYVSSWQDSSQLSAKAPARWTFDGQKYTGNGRPAGTPAGPRRFTNPAFKTADEGYGAVVAIDPQTGDRKWEFKMVDYTESGVLTTAADLVFAGGRDGNFFALDAHDGKCLWKVWLSGTVSSGPMTYLADGQQYVAVVADGALYAFGPPDQDK